MTEVSEDVLGELIKNAHDLTLDLTDPEWMSIISRERDGLPPCCGNISSLRDVLTSIAADDGCVGFLHAQKFVATLTWCFPSHDVPSDAMRKVMDQVGYVIPETEEHVRQREF